MKHWNSQTWNYLLLVNMAFPLYFMLQEPIGRMIPGLVLLAALAAVHIMLIKVHRYTGLFILAQLLLISVLGFVYDPLYTFLVYLLANFIKELSIRWIIGFTVLFAAAVAAMMIGSGNAGSLQAWVSMLPPIFGGAALPYVIHVSGRYKEMAERLQAASKEIERLAQQTERQRIAQELHDTLGHTLSLLALKGEVVERMMERAPEKAAAEARDIQQTATAALRRMRELVNDMKIVRLSEEWEHARALCAAANIRLDIRDRLNAEPGTAALTPLQESVIAMCMREALTNVVRHSQATQCVIELYADEAQICCAVEDNGAGAAHGLSDMTGGNGMTGMKQRLALLEGSLKVGPGSGKGLRLEMAIPIVRRQHGGE